MGQKALAARPPRAYGGRVRLVCALLLAAVAMPAAARAAEPAGLARADGRAAAVAVAGDEVLVASSGDPVTVHALRPGAEPSLRFKIAVPGLALPGGLAASRAWAAVAFRERPSTWDLGAPDAGRLAAGPLAGPLRLLATGSVSAAALTGDDLITIESVAGAPDRLLVRDLAAGGQPADVVPATQARLLPIVRAAGAYVAYGSRSQGVDTLAVVDRGSGAEVLRVAIPRAVEDFDVQEDGKLAVAVPRTKRMSAIGWATAGRRGLREVAAAARGSGVRIARDEIAFVRPVSDTAAELAISDLDGFARSASFPAPAIRAFDFDGERLAFLTGWCAYGAEVDGLTARPSPPAGPCDQAAATLAAPRRVALGPGRQTFEVRIGCPMAPADGCRGEVRTAWRPRGSTPRTLAAASFSVPRGEHRTVRLRVPAAAVAALGARASDRLTTHLAVVDGRDVDAATTLTTPQRGRPAPPPPTSRPPSRPRPRSEPEGRGGEFVIG